MNPLSALQEAYKNVQKFAGQFGGNQKPIVSPIPANDIITKGLAYGYGADEMKANAARQYNQKKIGQPTPTPFKASYNESIANAPNEKQKQAIMIIRKTNPGYEGTDSDIVAAYNKYGDRLFKGLTTPTPTPAPRMVAGARTKRPAAYQQVLQGIQKGFEKYGNPPAATMAGVFAEEAMKYPRLKEHPGILPGITIKESSGGKAKTKNWFNWAIYEPSYNEQDPAEVIRDVAAAIGGEDTPSSHYYKKFRDSGDILDLLERFAPRTENDTDLYHKQLLDWITMFENSDQGSKLAKR